MTNRLKEFRNKLKMTQTDLAVAVGTSQQQIYRYEQGQKVSLAMANKLAKALDVELSTLFPDQDTSYSFTNRKIGLETIAEPKLWLAEFQIRGFSNSLTFEVSHDEVKRIKSELEIQDDKFIIFTGNSNRRLVIHSRDIDSVTFLIVTCDTVESSYNDFQVAVALRGSDKPNVIEFRTFPDQIQDKVISLQEPNAPRFLNLLDKSGEDVVLRVDQIVYLDVPVGPVDIPISSNDVLDSPKANSLSEEPKSEGNMSMLSLLNQCLSIVTKEVGSDIAFQQFRLFLYVAQNEGVSQQDLIKPLGSSPGGVSRNVKKLSTYNGMDSKGNTVAAGYDLITAKDDPTNHRSQLLYLTNKGKALIQKLNSIG